MKALEFIKSNLRETLLKGIEDTLTSLKELLPKNSAKYQSLILLESQLNDLKRRTMHGTISEEASQLAKNRIRASLMDLINSIDPQDLEDQQQVSKKPSPTEPVVEKTVNVKPPEPINWRAELIERKKFDRLAFKVYSNKNTYLVELQLVNDTTTQLLVNQKIVLEEKLNFFNAVSSILNLITKNEETLKFEIREDGRLFPARLTYGADIGNETYSKVKLTIDGKIVYSEK